MFAGSCPGLIAALLPNLEDAPGGVAISSHYELMIEQKTPLTGSGCSKR